MSKDLSLSPSAERKRKQRARDEAMGISRIEISLAKSDRDKLDVLRHGTVRPDEQPWDAAEIIARLIRSAHTKHLKQLANLSRQTCKRCDKSLPADCGGLFQGDNRCYLTRKVRKLYP